MILLVDMDGPIAHFELAVYRHMRDNYRESCIELEDRNFGWVAHDYEDRFGWKAANAVRELCGYEGFFETLPAVEGAAETLNRLVDEHDINVRVCTSPALWNPTCASAKLDWLERNIGEGWASRCVITKDKTLVRGDYLIDDKPVITGSTDPMWKHVLWQTAYNTEGVGRFDYYETMEDWGDIAFVLPSENDEPFSVQMPTI